jgi:hypothetical protein
MTEDLRSPYLLQQATLLNEIVLREREDRGRLSDRVELLIGGVPWTDNARDLVVENSGDEGGATASFQTKKPLERYTGSDMNITVDGKPYFTGKLKRPGVEGGSRFIQAAVGMGPFADMATQFLGEQKSYTFFNLRNALFDVFDQAYDKESGIGDVIGGDHIVIEEADFTEETSLVEVAKGLTTPANFVLLDTQQGNKIAFRRPRPGSTGEVKKWFTPDDYTEGNFTVEWSIDAPYNRVIVFRRGEEDNDYEVREVQLIDQSNFRTPAPKNRIWYVPEWIGDVESASQEAFEIARDLERQGNFSLTVRLDPDIWRYDRIACSRERELPEGLRRELFRMTIGQGISANLSDETMTLTGELLLQRVEPVEPIKFNPDVLYNESPYLVN